jgi:peptide/nickel transport system substrate-binding protein
VFASQLDGLVTFDPGEAYEIAAQIIASSIYDRLVRYEAEDMTKLVGGVAESWTVSPDSIPTRSSCGRTRSSRAARR